jgi:hypothetical protein
MRQEHKPDTQIGIIKERMSQLGDFAAEDLVWDLGHYSRSIARFSVGIDRAPMNHVAHRGQSVS